MQQLKAYKFRIYPNESQQILLANTFGCKRFIYNHYLSVQQSNYASGKKHLSFFDITKEITQLKKEFPWLRQVDDWALKSAAEDLSTSYKNFFQSISGKRKGPKLNFPTYKKKFGKQSYRTRGNIHVCDNYIIVPKLGKIKAIIHQQLPDKCTLKQFTVSLNPDGKYYVSVLTEQDITLWQMSGKEVGCDLGIKDLLITSDGMKFVNPREIEYIAKTKQLLTLRQKQLSRKKDRNSKNYKRLKRQVAQLYSLLTRQRNEYYHILSKYLVLNYDSIYMESLAVKNMIKNRSLSKEIHDIAWSTLLGMIQYKANWRGKTFHQVSRYFASSKTCNTCGHKLDSLSLAVREWECPSCGEYHDRDLNAAKNIKNMGQIDLYETPQATGGVVNIEYLPMVLQKLAIKIERSDSTELVSYGSRQAASSLDSQ